MFLTNLLKYGSFCLFALSKDSANFFDESTEKSNPNYESFSDNSLISLSLGLGCLLIIANVG
jgi:hypothetical protein